MSPLQKLTTESTERARFMERRFRAPFFLLLVLLLAAGCAGNAPSPTVPPPSTPTLPVAQPTPLPVQSLPATDSTPAEATPTPVVIRIPPKPDCRDLSIEACVQITIAEAERMVQTIPDQQKRSELLAFLAEQTADFRARVDAEIARGQTGKNERGELIFLDLSQLSFETARDSYLSLIASEIKWWGFSERAPEARQQAARLVSEFSGQEAVYQGTGPFAFNPMRRVESYLAGEYTYEVDIENERIVAITLNRREKPICGLEFDRQAMLARAQEYIARLAPDIDLRTLTLKEEAGCLGFAWVNENIVLPQKHNGEIFISFNTDGTLQDFRNSLYIDKP